MRNDGRGSQGGVGRFEARRRPTPTNSYPGFAREQKEKGRRGTNAAALPAVGSTGGETTGEGKIQSQCMSHRDTIPSNERWTAVLSLSLSLLAPLRSSRVSIRPVRASPKTDLGPPDNLQTPSSTRGAGRRATVPHACACVQDSRVALAADLLVAVGLGRKELEGRLNDASTETEDEVKGRL